MGKKPAPKRQTQADTVLQHLQSGKRISPAVAINVYGIYRLAPAIHILRKRGYNIDTVMHGDMVGKKYASYKLV